MHPCVFLFPSFMPWRVPRNLDWVSVVVTMGRERGGTLHSRGLLMIGMWKMIFRP